MSNPRRVNGHRRNQVRRRVLAEEDLCWLCERPVDKTLGIMPGVHSKRCLAEQRQCDGCVYHPKSPVVDEVIPVSQGGSPIDRRNCRLAHRDCNRDRSDGTEANKRAPRVDPVTTTRSW